MNLTIDPWIPAVRANGRRELFSLQDLFAQARELHDLAVKPHERVALMRLLLCITQAALDGPADETEWQNCQPLIQRSVRGYLQKWLGAFELFGEGPRFLQTKPGVVAELSPVMENEGITRLDLCLASGESNATLFDNSGSERRSLIAARAAICLLTYQCYSPLLGRGYKGRSPCADNSMLHTFLVSTNLLQTIQLNLLDHTTMQDCYGSDGVGHPIWEAVPKGPPSESSRRMLTQTYLGRLVPMARSIWLTSAQEIVLGNGLVYESFLDSGYREAAATVTTLKTKLVVLRAQSNKAIWREFPAICIRNRSSDGVSGPLAFRNQICDSQVGVWVGALVSDQAKIEDVVESTYSLPAGMFSEFGRASYERGVAYAEEREGGLIQSVKAYASALKVTSPAYNRARQQFWTRVEQHLSALFDLARNTNLAADLPNCAWGKAVQAAAFDAYEQSCPHQTPRQIEAYALGLRKLTFRPKNQQPKAVAHE